MKIGLCLAGGGIKGAAHIGALKVFEEENISFQYLSGTSSGSIVATLFACGYTSDEIYYLFKQYSKKIKYVDGSNIFKTIFGLIFKGKIIINGLNSGKVIEKIINEACNVKGIKNMSDIKIPLLIPSVDLHSGNIYLFSNTKPTKRFSDNYIYINNIEIGNAVRASCSYPGVFSPCKYKNTELIDGGLRENVPWQETKAMGADRVLSIVFQSSPKEKCCPNIIDVVSTSLEILCHELSNYELFGADYLLRIKSKDISLLDVSEMDYLYELGYTQTKSKITEIKNSLYLNSKTF